MAYADALKYLRRMPLLMNFDPKKSLRVSKINYLGYSTYQKKFLEER